MSKKKIISVVSIVGLLLLTVCFLFLKNWKKQKIGEWYQTGYYQEANNVLLNEAPDTNRVVFIGNSITKQWLLFDSTFFISHKYINRGIIGQTTSHFLNRFQQDVINLSPRIVVIGGGINDVSENDGKYDETASLANTVAMAELAKKNNIKVILTSVLPAVKFAWNPEVENAPQKIKSLNEKVKNYAKANNLIYVDYYSHVVDENGAFNLKYSDDGAHPNKEGYLIMKPLIQGAINSLLR